MGIAIYKGTDLIQTTYQGNDLIGSINKYTPLTPANSIYYTGSCFNMNGGGTFYVEYTSSAVDVTDISASMTYTAFFDNISFGGIGFLGYDYVTLGFKDVFGLEFIYTGGAGDNTYTLKAQDVTIATGAGPSYSSNYAGVVVENGNYKLYLGSTTPVATGSGWSGIVPTSSYFFINNAVADSRQIVTSACKPILFNSALSQRDVEYLIDTYYS